jgi:trk system potassium uptake protein
MSSRNRYFKIFRILTSPQSTLPGSFAAAILVGTILLSLPWFHVSDRVGLVDALFTATSAVCVTGLTVVDTGTDYTFLGQVVILLLIQMGGLGIMTLAAIAAQMTGRRMSLTSQAVVADSIFQQDVASEFRSVFRSILTITFVTEGVGSILLFVYFSTRMDPDTAVFSALFHSISAFCNAGFSIHRDNLVEFRDSVGILVVVMALIVLGGLGYVVLHELWIFVRDIALKRRRLHTKRFSLHTRLVLTISAVLIAGGAAALFCFGLSPAELYWPDRLLHSLFQSVTARTAGFNTVDIGRIPSASLFVLIMLMFVGGSPGSCAGGVKTTALAIWLARLHASVRGRKEVRLLDRRVTDDLLQRAELLLGLAVFWNIVGILVMLTTQAHLSVSALDLIFEQVSAFGTVGLSTGLSPNLSTAGKLWLCATMFVGRLGPLTVAVWVFSKETVHISYPKGTVMIG